MTIDSVLILLLPQTLAEVHIRDRNREEDNCDYDENHVLHLGLLIRTSELNHQRQVEPVLVSH